MPDEIPRPDDLAAARRARQKISVLCACSMLVLAALALLFLPPNEKLPRAARVFMAAFDLVAAAVLGLVARQKFSGKSGSS